MATLYARMTEGETLAEEHIHQAVGPPRGRAHCGPLRPPPADRTDAAPARLARACWPFARRVRAMSATWETYAHERAVRRVQQNGLTGHLIDCTDPDASRGYGSLEHVRILWVVADDDTPRSYGIVDQKHEGAELDALYADLGVFSAMEVEDHLLRVAFDGVHVGFVAEPIGGGFVYVVSLADLEQGKRTATDAVLAFGFADTLAAATGAVESHM